MPALSPPSSLPSNRISPRPKPAKVQPKANSNPFAPLSPDLPENALQPSVISQNLTAEPSPVKPGNIRYYTRHTLLTLAKKCKKRGWETPADLAPYEVWFGKPAQANKADMVDPAIASIGQPGGGRRGQPGGMGAGGGGGGFGEGFGFGGGIGGGGRGIGRGGGRNIGLRRQNNDQAPEGDRTIQQQMNKLVAKTNGGGRQQPGDNRDRERERDRGQPMRMGNNDGRNEWRRDNYNHAGQRMMQQEDEAEPAWMDDSAPEPDPAIAQMDPLIHFIPGEDMIAKHKQTMKERDERWRFGGAPSSAPTEAKPKVFNNADYLRPNKVASPTPDIVEAAAQPEQPSTAFASRFQRFFAAEQQQLQQQQQHSAPPPPPPQQQAPPPPPGPQSAPPSKPDDHASRLMGLLSLSDPHREPPHAGHMPHHQMNHPMTSPPPPFLPPPQMHHPQAYEHNTPHALLQQLYNPSGAGPPRPPPHMMLPSQLPAGYGAPSYARPPFPPPPQFYGPGPVPQPQPPQHFQHQQIPPPHVLHPHPGPPGFGHRAPLPPGMDRQQEILNTLFAGLGPGR